MLHAMVCAIISSGSVGLGIAIMAGLRGAQEWGGGRSGIGWWTVRVGRRSTQLHNVRKYIT